MNDYSTSQAHQPSPKQYFVLGLALCSLLLGYRIVSLYLVQPGLFFDEAYYYGWSQDPAFGYYSKPPVVAWLIWLTTTVLGKSEFAVKLSAPILHLLTASVVFLITQKVANARAALMAMLIFFSMPFVSLESWFITTDTPLLLFWSLLCLFYLSAKETNLTRYWLLAGLAGGLGLLSKYTMGLFPIAMVTLLLFTRDWQLLKNPKFWLLIVMVILVFLPNLVWNHQHGFPSIMHTVDLAGARKKDGNPIEFFFSQFGVMGPIAFAALLIGLIACRSMFKQYPEILFLTLIPLLAFWFQSFHNEVYANWAGMAYVTGSVLAGVVLSRAKVRWFITAVVINLLLMFGFYHYEAGARLLGIELHSKNTPYSRVAGWRELGNHAHEIELSFPEAVFASDRRIINSYLSFYLSDHNKVRRINPVTPAQDHYDLLFQLDSTESPVILVLSNPIPNSMQQQFDQTELIKRLAVPIYEKQMIFYFYKATRDHNAYSE